MSSLCFYPLSITVPTIPIRHIYPPTTHVSAFDKMSNEGRHSAFPRTKMQVGGFRGPSQAIRKIHFVIGSRRMTYVWEPEGLGTFLTDILHPNPHPFYYLLIFWRSTPSREWNSKFFSFILQRFDFRAWNNRVWRGKLYCLTRQTILFGSRNNILPGTFCLFSGNGMYSFPKQETFSKVFVHVSLHFISSLTGIWKVFVSGKRQFGK